MDVLEELTAEELPSRRHVELRLDDWERRIRDLYAMLEGWLPPGWTASTAQDTTFLSTLMREVGVPARELPDLLLSGPGGARGLVMPQALWIIGANGSLSAMVGSSHFQLVDRAEIFAPPLWKIVFFDDQSHSIALDRSAFSSVFDRGR